MSSQHGCAQQIQNSSCDTCFNGSLHLQSYVMFMYENCLHISFLEVPIYHVPTIFQFFLSLLMHHKGKIPPIFFYRKSEGLYVWLTQYNYILDSLCTAVPTQSKDMSKYFNRIVLI